MNSTNRQWLIVAVAVLVGCDGSENSLPADKTALRIPPAACQKAQTALDEVSGKGPLVYKNNGAATVEQAFWLTMGSASRDALIQGLAINASCKAPAPLAEVNVEIRSESGVILATQTQDLSSSDFAIEE